MTSVVVQTYESPRLAKLETVLSAWLRETPDVWLADCSRSGFETSLPIKRVFIASKDDEGNRVRHAVALLTSGDLVIKADDDVLPRPGLLADFVRYASAVEGIFGLIGRRFLGPLYYGETQFFAARKVRALTRVDFAGVVTCAPRSLLPFDLRGCDTPIEDLHWQMGAFPWAAKFVIPTAKYENLPEASHGYLLFHRPEARRAREAYYGPTFERNYGGRPWAERFPGIAEKEK